MRSEHRRGVVAILALVFLFASIFTIYYDSYSSHTGRAALKVSLDDGGGGGGGSSGGSTPVCGNGILETGEQCDGSAGLPTCVGLGYYSGSVTCTGSCTEDTSACSNCGNDVCDDSETCSSCVSDCAGETADCSGGQICQNVMGSGTCIAPAPTVCNDTTSASTCSSITGAPWYCNSNGTLIENCGTCGCPEGSTCQEDNTTCTVNSISVGSLFGVSGSGNSGTTLTVDDAVVLSVESGAQSIDSAGSNIQYSWGGVGNGDVVEFEIAPTSVEVENSNDNNNVEKHTIKVNRVSRARKFVEVTIRSDPIDVVLYEGEPQRVDVDGDGIEDVVVLATNIGLRDFDIDIQEIDKNKLNQEEVVNNIASKIRERRVFFPEPLLSPVFKDSPESSMYEFVIVNALIFVSMVFLFFKFTKEIKRK